MPDSIVGDIIEIEHTDDHTASSPTWNLVGKTKDTVEMSAETEVTDARHHEAFNRDKTATSEAWEISFSADIVTGTAQLETLGLIDTNSYELRGHVDSDETDNANDAVTVTVYDTEADRDAGTVKWEVGTDDYVIVVDSGEVATEDYSTREFVIHSRRRPVRLDAGGSL